MKLQRDYITDAFTVEVSSTRMTEQGLWVEGFAALEGVLQYPSRGDAEFVPGDVIKDSDEDMVGLPITIQHPRERVNTRNISKYGKGTVMFAQTDLEHRPPRQRVRLLVTSMDGIRDVQSRKRIQLSTGYDRDFEKEDGEYEGKTYNKRQTRRRPNHLAIVERARSGPDARLILDAYEGDDDMTEEEIQALIEKHTAPLKKTIEEQQKTIEALEEKQPAPAPQEPAPTPAAPEEPSNEDSMTPEEIQKQIREGAAKRAVILSEARDMGVELTNADEATNAELMQQVCKAKGLDNLDAAEVPGAFRVLVSQKAKPGRKWEREEKPKRSTSNNDADGPSEIATRIRDLESKSPWG